MRIFGLETMQTLSAHTKDIRHNLNTLEKKHYLS